MRFAAEDIADHRGAVQGRDKAADRSWKNNPGAEAGRVEKVLIDPIASGSDKLLDNVHFFCRFAQFYNDEELGRTKAFLLIDKIKLEEYEKKIELYHDLVGRIPIDIERTVFAGFFEVSHAPFITAVVENIGHFKGLLIQRLVDRYQNTAKKWILNIYNASKIKY